MNNVFEFGRISKLRKKTIDGPIAQLAEHGTENAGVGGPIPPWATILEINGSVEFPQLDHFSFRILLVFVTIPKAGKTDESNRIATYL